MVDAAMSFRSQTSRERGPRRRPARRCRSRRRPVCAAYRDLAAERHRMRPAQAPLWVEQWIASTQARLLRRGGRRGRQACSGAGARSRRIGAVPHRALHGRQPRQRQFSGRRPEPCCSRRTFSDRRRCLRRSERRGPTSTRWCWSGCCRNSTACQTRCWRCRIFKAPTSSLAVDLDGGFEALLSRVSGKRKRKKHRCADAQVRGRRRASAASRRRRPTRSRGCWTPSSP